MSRPSELASDRCRVVGVPVERIVAGITVERVVACAAVDDVVAGSRIDGVVTAKRIDRVRTSCAIMRLAGCRAVDHVSGSCEREVGDVDTGIVDPVDLDRALDGRGRPVLADGNDRVAAAGGFEHPIGEVRRRYPQPAEVDAILVRRRAAGGIEAVDDIGPKPVEL